MAKKKKPEEHENLERWLVSYADFMTLLFATFVVLYALSQLNVNEFKKVEESLRKAFSVQSLLDGGSGVMSQGESIVDANAANSVIDSLMMEFISQKYEQESYEQIKKQIDDMNKGGTLSNVSAIIDERGLVIIISDKDVLFKSGSAELTDEAKKILEKVGKLIVERFAMHIIKVEGHTDKVPVTGRYPSNWELSSARASSIVRYLIDRFKIMPNLMAAIGYADTRPAADNSSIDNAQKNRRIEIMILKNKYKDAEKPGINLKDIPLEEQKRLQAERERIVKDIKFATKMEDLNFTPNKSETIIDDKNISKLVSLLCDYNVKEFCNIKESLEEYFMKFYKEDEDFGGIDG